jgi:transposase
MRFYTGQHQFYCGIDLHASWMYVCIMNQVGRILMHKNIRTDPDVFRKVIEPYRADLAVAAECVFCWYWLADFCEAEKVTFVLGHALYMRAIHGAKAKNDRIDSMKIAQYLRGGMLPQAYVYPAGMRATRDLLRRRMYLVRHRAECVAHVENTVHQYNLAPLEQVLSRPKNHPGVVEHFPEGSVQKTVAADLEMVNHYTGVIQDLERSILATVRVHDEQAFRLLKSICGVGDILGLTMLYEIHDIARFPRVQEFLSYARLVKCTHESNGKKSGTKRTKVGNAHLKWAFSQAAMLFVRHNPPAAGLKKNLEKRFGKGKALAILARRLGSAVYFMLKRRQVFSPERFYANCKEAVASASPSDASPQLNRETAPAVEEELEVCEMTM